MIKKYFKRALVVAALFVTSLLSFNFAESYFEISKNLDIFSSLYRELNVYYVDPTNPGKLVKTGIDAMLNSLDPYTNYIPESKIEDYRFMTTGQYGGIGSLIRTKDDKIIISEPYEGFPAQKAGLNAGDVVLAVDGKPSEGRTTSELSDILRGQAGTEIILSIERPNTGEKMDVTLTREEIKIKDVPYHGMLDDKTGYIKLTSFTETASRDVKAAFKELRDSLGMEQLVFDLRGNGGGLLREAVDITNFFIPRGEVVVETKGKVKEWDRTHKTINEPLDLNIPLVVLIDEFSASASEIVAGTLQDLDRAVIIGQNSFGKGLVQQTRSLSYNSQLKLTVAKYYTPSGRCIQRIDYSNRGDDGRAAEVPDSLITEYRTKAGRVVKDGAGIMPDIDVPVNLSSDLAIDLVNEGLIFDFATDFFYANKTVAQPEEFSLSAEQYDAFAQLVAQTDFEYKTTSTEMMKDLQSTLENDEFLSEVEAEFEALNAKLQRDKKADVYKFKPEISRILENEIVSRYYFQSGRIRASLAGDKEIARALEVLNNDSSYEAVLNGTCDYCQTKKG